MDACLVGWQLWIECLLALAGGVYALGLGWFTRGIRAQPAVAGHRPFVSVVVAARNEAGRIPDLLQGLDCQTYPADRWEVIVVDDRSTDHTAEVARAHWGGLPRMVVLCAEGAGKKAALAQGLAAASGELILTTDADCRVPPTWVEGMAAACGPGVDMAVGFSQIAAPGQTRGWREGLEALDFLHLMGAALGSASQGGALAASGQNLAFRAEVFARVGGYRRVQHRASGDDVLLLQLVRRQGGKIAFATDTGTYVVHPPSPSWRALLAQRARWASNAPYQLLLSPGFFAYISLVFGCNLLLVASPVLWFLGGVRAGWVVALWLGKGVAEAVLSWRASAFFGRRDLRCYFPAWWVVQPFYLVLAGMLGSLGIFDWKGRAHRWGRRRLRP
ncbi:MAG: glycosyltransferase [Candidatus Latescibacteria bacterium]|nr:glycosyltransferase [Candidatus Latescibacterota bacterium]